MIVTTTQNVEGRQIAEYKGIVFGEVVSGVNFVKDLFSGITDIFGGRSSTYENELQEAREKAIDEMCKRAERLGANAVVGVDVDYEVLGKENGMLMVSVSLLLASRGCLNCWLMCSTCPSAKEIFSCNSGMPAGGESITMP